ncbi:polysaccharide deacetylase family protein [Kiritimatiellaeota bacterium B1221]|nr:polysaccharide deacetylase family protein [Kiritimatiellaeota bacterium B1221]
MGEKYGVKFTFFLIVVPLEQGKGASNYGTWEGWQSVLDAGHDVQAHSYKPGKPADDRSEADEREDYRKAIEALEGKLKGNRCLVMAYAWGIGRREIAQEYFIAARGGDGRPSTPNRGEIRMQNKCILGVSSVRFLKRKV